jgi:hypothetical protein
LILHVLVTYLSWFHVWRFTIKYIDRFYSIF